MDTPLAPAVTPPPNGAAPVSDLQSAVLAAVLADFRRSAQSLERRTLESETLGVWSFDLPQQKREKLILQAREAYETNPIAHQIVDALVDFILGAGLQVSPIDRDDESQEIIDEFRERNRMEDREPEIVRRTLIDGEVLVRKIQVADIGIMLREVSPLALHNKGDVPGRPGWDSGVIPTLQDIEAVSRYEYDADGEGNFKRLRPEEAEHIKIAADVDMLHGRSYLSALLSRLAQYTQWVDQRVILNRLKSAIYMITTVDGDSTAISTLDGDIIKSSRAGQTQAAKMPPPGTRLLATKGVKHELVHANVEAADCKDDGMRMLRDIAVGAGLSEWIVTGDSSSTTRASSETAESPMVRRIQRLRTAPFGSSLKRLYNAELKFHAAKLGETTTRKQLTAAAKAFMDQAETDRLTAKGDNRRDKRARSTIEEIRANPKSYETIEVKRTFRVELQWPEIIPRGTKETAEALSIIADRGMLSRQTYDSVMGFDYRREKERIEDEMAPRDIPEAGAELPDLPDEGAPEPETEQKTEEEAA